MSDSEELRFRMREEDALERFLDAWRKLPPLARAATAEHWRLEAVRSVQQQQRAEESARKTGLRRRAAVNRACVTADTALHSLWRELCAVADEEADSLGQGPLVRAADLEAPLLAIDKERVEKQTEGDGAGDVAAVADLVGNYKVHIQDVIEKLFPDMPYDQLEMLARKAIDTCNGRTSDPKNHLHVGTQEWINETRTAANSRYTELCAALEIDPSACVSLHETALARIQELKAQRALYHEGVRKYDEIIYALQTRSGATLRQHADVLKHIKTAQEAKKEST